MRSFCVGARRCPPNSTATMPRHAAAAISPTGMVKIPPIMKVNRHPARKSPMGIHAAFAIAAMRFQMKWQPTPLMNPVDTQRQPEYRCLRLHRPHQAEPPEIPAATEAPRMPESQLGAFQNRSSEHPAPCKPKTRPANRGSYTGRVSHLAPVIDAPWRAVENQKMRNVTPAQP